MASSFLLLFYKQHIIVKEMFRQHVAYMKLQFLLKFSKILTIIFYYIMKVLKKDLNTNNRQHFTLFDMLQQHLLSNMLLSFDLQICV